MPKDFYPWKDFLKQFVQEVLGGSSMMIAIWAFLAFVNTPSNTTMLWFAILFGVSGKVALPSTVKLWETKLNISFPGWVRILVFIACWALIWSIVNPPIVM